MLRSLFSALILLTFAIGPAHAQLVKRFQGKTLQQMVDISVNTPSRSEKVQIRSYLAKNFPNEPEGLFAQAWISDNNGAPAEDVIRLYERAVEAKPDFVSAMINLANAYTNAKRFDDSYALYEKAIKLDPVDPDVVRNTYFLFKNNFKDEERANRFLKEAEQTVRTAPYVFDFVRGIAQQSADNLEKAADFYESAMDKGGTFEVLERLTNIRLKLLEQEGASTRDRFQPLVRVIRYGEANSDAGALLYAAKTLDERFRSKRDALKYYEESYDIYPTAEAATDGFTVMANYAFDRSYNLLERASRDLPDSWKVRSYMSWANFNFRYEPDLAERYAREALDLAELQSDIKDAARWFGDFYEERGEYDKALAVYQKSIGGLFQDARRGVRADIIDNRIQAQDYDAAAAALADIEKYDNINAAWAALRHERLNAGRFLQNERQSFLRNNPFLKDWEQRFGASLTLAVEFESNSDVIRPETLPALDKAADALNAPGGDKYVFLIEGHTDSRGTDDINMPLSQRRADAVARYLHERHGLPMSRLRTAGYGPRQPIATNETESGRQHNRRVEIRPYGNVSEPEIAVSSVLDAKALTVSPDGRIGAMGYEPVQLWDLHQKVKIRDLYRGGWVRAFSPNGRYLAVSSNYTEISGDSTHAVYIYDTKTGNAVAQVINENDIDDLSWSPFSNAVAYTDRNGFLKIFDIRERRISNITRVGIGRMSGSVVWLRNGEQIVTSQAEGDSIKVWDAQDLSLMHEFPGVSWVHELGQSYDGHYLVAVDNQRVMSIWDTRTWNDPVQVRSPLIPDRIVSHPSKPWVLMNDTFDSSAGLALVDLSTGKILASREGEQDLGISFSPDGTQVMAGKGSEIRWYDTATLQPTDTMSGFAARPEGLSLDERNDLLLSRDDSGTYVWDLATGTRVHKLSTDTELGWSRLSEDGRVHLTVDKDNNIVVFDTDDFREEKRDRLDFAVSRMRIAGDYIAFAGKPDGPGKDTAETGIVEVRDRETLKRISRFEVPFVTDRLLYDKLYGTDFTGLAVSKEGLLTLSTRWKDGYGHGYTESRLTRVFDAKSGEELNVISSSKNVTGVGFDSEDGSLVRILQNNNFWYYYEARTGRYVRSSTIGTIYKHKLDDGRTIEWSYDVLRLGGHQVFFRGTLRDIAVHESKNLIVALTSANELVFFDLGKLERQLTIVIKNNDQWLAYAPTGEFAASLAGTDNVYWSLGDNYLPFDALKSRYERPHILQERLSRIMDHADVVDPVEPDKPKVDPDLFNVPYKVTLASAATDTLDADSYTLKLRVEKDTADLPDPEFEYKLNGRVVLKSRGFDEEPVYDGGEIVGIDRKFDLREGENIIEASLVYKDARVLTQHVEITRKVQKKKNAPVRSTTQLWYFGVGISDYEIKSQDLEYAHADALSLEKVFKSQEGTLYSKVNTRVLVNDQATERDIRVEMNDFLRQASAEDVIVIFLAGHGVQDNEQKLYLVTYDGDITRPYTGMQVDKFRDFLASRPINQKAVFLMDICHAGTAGPRRRGRVTAEDAVRELADGTGTIVVASSTGAQSSLEDASFGGGHGAFTAALLEGLAGKADDDAGDGNGYNSIQELISYTARRVPQITDGQQHPTIPLQENVLDFPMSAAN
ncbi:OmpA family protein [Roseibium aggregatum]|uniref:OmpA family protein n=1 Tax=Roseibium aggregatum TaxID=187304 RepID=A0A926NR08_9HYPH|nr:OmpA family protein [Roseibium aggregatum]MBD1544864.1 OmpA family protein [Roseibium aggregatum]